MSSSVVLSPVKSSRELFSDFSRVEFSHVKLTQAELKLQGGQYEQAVATLERARRNAGRPVL